MRMPKYLTRFLSKETIAEGTIAFKIEKPQGFIFKPGQNVDLEIVSPRETDKEGNKRTFSILSSPDADELEFATRIRESAWKRNIQNARAGMEIELDGPYGNMILHSDHSKPAVFLAGGIGITPFISMIRHLRENGSLAPNAPSDWRIHLFYSNRRSGSAPFMNELNKYAEEGSNFKFTPIFTGEISWQGEKGYLDIEMVQKYVAELEKAIFYIAGPPRVVESIYKMLETAGISPDNIKREDFAGY